jgi:hypothetical protein
MNIIKSIVNRFKDTDVIYDKFSTALPVPLVVLDDFLDNDLARSMYEESLHIPDNKWRDFTRKGSYMKECNDLMVCPQAANFVNQIHSAEGMKWLSAVSGIPGLIPDPYLTGAGYARSFNGDSLKVHTDFNWNDRLRLHRELSLIVYLTPDWNPEYGGALDFYDFEKKDIVKSVDSVFNRCILWKYHKKGFHGYDNPINCPEDVSRSNIRLFFYSSSSEYDPLDRPHRSLYWYNNDLQEPYDIPSKK